MHEGDVVARAWAFHDAPHVLHVRCAKCVKKGIGVYSVTKWSFAMHTSRSCPRVVVSPDFAFHFVRCSFSTYRVSSAAVGST